MYLLNLYLKTTCSIYDIRPHFHGPMVGLKILVEGTLCINSVMVGLLWVKAVEQWTSQNVVIYWFLFTMHLLGFSAGGPVPKYLYLNTIDFVM